MKVLIATDCSENAKHAADFLHDLPITEPLALTFVTALGDPYGASPESTQQWIPDVLAQERTRAESHHEDLAQMFADRCDSIERVCRPGHPVKVILGIAEEIDADLIVMGAQGHSFIGRLLIGSVSDSVATHAKCSVLIVRPETDEETEPSEPCNKVMNGYDRSHASRHAVDSLLAHAWNTKTSVDLISIAPMYDYLLGSGLSVAAIQNEERIFEEMKRSGKEMEEAISDEVCDVQSIVIHDQRIGDAIVETADKESSDLVVVGDSGHSLLDDFLLGSTSKYVLRHATKSVWISRLHRDGNGD